MKTLSSPGAVSALTGTVATQPKTEAAIQDNSLARISGACSVLLGVSYFVVGITYLLMPEAQRVGNFAQFMTSVAENPTMLLVSFLAYALGAILAFAAIPAMSATVRAGHEGWVRWASNLALLGFAVTLVNVLRLFWIDQWRAAHYLASDAALREAMRVNQNLIDLDPQGLLLFGAVGFWVLTVSLLALRGGQWSKPLAYLGIAVGVVYWLLTLSSILNVEAVLYPILAIVGGVILGPLWYIGMGMRLRRASV